MRVARKIYESLCQPFQFPDIGSMQISSCIGIAIYPDHGSDGQPLLNSADAARYLAKLKGRSKIQLFVVPDISDKVDVERPKTP